MNFGILPKSKSSDASTEQVYGNLLSGSTDLRSRERQISPFTASFTTTSQQRVPFLGYLCAAQLSSAQHSPTQHSMRSWLSKQSPLLGSRFATALLALTSSPLSSSVSSAFTPRAFGGLSLHSSVQSQSQSQSQSQCHPSNSKWQLLRGGSVSSAPSSQSVQRSMSTTAEAPVKTGNNVSAGEKLDALRSRMKELDLDVYLVPSDDPHLSGTCEWS